MSPEHDLICFRFGGYEGVWNPETGEVNGHPGGGVLSELLADAVACHGGVHIASASVFMMGLPEAEILGVHPVPEEDLPDGAVM